MPARPRALLRRGRPPLSAPGEATERGLPFRTVPGPTRAAVILPWERPQRSNGNGGGADQVRAAEARLAEAIGLTASIGLVVVHSAIIPLRERRPGILLGEGQVAGQEKA